MRATLQFACDPPLARLRLAGEVDDTADARLGDVFDCLQFRGCLDVELDAEAVTFITTGSLRLIAAEQQRLRRADGDLSVVAASPYYSLVTRLSGYDSLMARAPQPRLSLLRTVRHLHVAAPPSVAQ